MGANASKWRYHEMANFLAKIGCHKERETGHKQWFTPRGQVIPVPEHSRDNISGNVMAFIRQTLRDEGLPVPPTNKSAVDCVIAEWHKTAAEVRAQAEALEQAGILAKGEAERSKIAAEAARREIERYRQTGLVTDPMDVALPSRVLWRIFARAYQSFFPIEERDLVQRLRRMTPEQRARVADLLLSLGKK